MEEAEGDKSAENVLLEVVEWCPACEKKGIKAEARFFQVNFNEALFACRRTTQCHFPFALEYIPVYIKRDFRNMDKPDCTPVVCRADVLRKATYLGQTPLQRFLEKQKQDLLSDSPGVPSAVEKSVSPEPEDRTSVNDVVEDELSPHRIKAHKELAEILGEDFAFVLDLEWNEPVESSPKPPTEPPSVAAGCDFGFAPRVLQWTVRNPLKPYTSVVDCWGFGLPRKKQRGKTFYYHPKKRRRNLRKGRISDKHHDKTREVSDKSRKEAPNMSETNAVSVVDESLNILQQQVFSDRGILTNEKESVISDGEVSKSVEENAGENNFQLSNDFPKDIAKNGGNVCCKTTQEYTNIPAENIAEHNACKQLINSEDIDRRLLIPNTECGSQMVNDSSENFTNILLPIVEGLECLSEKEYSITREKQVQAVNGDSKLESLEEKVDNKNSAESSDNVFHDDVLIDFSIL